MKKCLYCNKEYPESYYGIALTTPKKVYRRRKCKYCYNETKRKLDKKYREFLLDYKEKRGCQKCGVKDPRVLEFHHDSGNKEFSIAERGRDRYGKDRLEREMKKCSIYCANCHRIFHFENRKKTV